MSVEQDILDASKAFLREWGYEVVPSSAGEPNLYFENRILVGAVYVLKNIEELRGNWESIQESFFRRHAPGLRASGQKSLNVVLAYLIVDETTSSIIEELEYNFVASRKIIRVGVCSENVADCLLPLAPILSEKKFTLQDPIEVLQNTLRFSPQEMEALLDADEDRLIRLKLEAIRSET